MENNTYTHAALDRRDNKLMFKGSKSEVQKYLQELAKSPDWNDVHLGWFNTFICTKEEVERFSNK